MSGFLFQLLMITDKQELLQKMKQGDQRAFRQLFSQYYRYLTTIAWRMTHEDATAKDMAQDAFAELWKRRSDLPDDLQVKSYLRQIVVNKCLNYLKKQKRITFEDTPIENPTGAADDAQHQIEVSDLKAAVQIAVDELPDKCRIIFSMSRFEGMSHRDIAKKLGISVKTVENQMTIALKRIRLALKAGGFILGVFPVLSFLPKIILVLGV